MTETWEKTWTKQQLRDEYEHRINERLGILCGSSEPTPEQREIARREADEWLELVTRNANR